VLVSVKFFEWQLLRVLARAEAARQAPPTGRELRLVPTRQTFDGTFLDRLVGAGLIEVAAKPTPPADGKENEPAQFRTRYRLTDRGRQAAEYGEYDKPFTPQAKDVSGRIAELRADAGAKSGGKKKPKK
jgi:hypothetical protein